MSLASASNNRRWEAYVVGSSGGPAVRASTPLPRDTIFLHAVEWFLWNLTEIMPYKWPFLKGCSRSEVKGQGRSKRNQMHFCRVEDHLFSLQPSYFIVKTLLYLMQAHVSWRKSRKSRTTTITSSDDVSEWPCNWQLERFWALPTFNSVLLSLYIRWTKVTLGKLAECFLGCTCIDDLFVTVLCGEPIYDKGKWRQLLSLKEHA